MDTNITFDFTGRTALVTGAARGIGLEVARHLADSGATVFLMDLDARKVEEAAASVGAHALVGDVSSTEDAERVVAEAVQRSGRLDILVNNAGILRDRVLWRLEDADWDAVLAVHLSGTFKMTRAAVPQLRAGGFGRIVNVTSYTGLHGNVGQANYAAAKAGIIGLTKTAAKELARFGITVNAVSPNAETRMIASIPDDKRAEVVKGYGGLAHNQLLAGVLSPLEVRLHWLLRQNDEPGRLHDEHLRLLEAIASGDPDRAAAVSIDHLATSRELVFRLLFVEDEAAAASAD